MVNVDTVYQRVLALANKEQRGYITPQEFNTYANHAQMEIFEQYFYDTNQFKRLPGNDSEYHDMVDLIDEKLYIFKKSGTISHGSSIDSIDNDPITQTSLLYRIGDVYTGNIGMGGNKHVEEVKAGDIIKLQNSPLTKPTWNRPVYYIRNNNIYFDPINFGNQGSIPYIVNYIVKPRKVNWTYMVVSEKPLYNSTASDHQHFELHESEETKLVMKILLLAGVGIKDYNLSQLAAQKEIGKIQQEKQ